MKLKNSEVLITIIANAQVSFISMGGSDKIFIEMARVWKKLGIHLKVLGCREAGVMCKDAGIGEHFQQVSGFDVERVGLLFAYFLRTMSALFQENIVKEGLVYSSSDFSPDLVFAFWQKLWNRQLQWVAGIYLIAPNPFLVASARTVRGVGYWLMQRLNILLMKWLADQIVVLCQEDKDFLIKKGIGANRITIISGGVDLEAIQRIPDQEKKYDGCFVGRFHHQKGLYDLIEIWKEVTAKLPEAKLAVVGWGDAHWVSMLRGAINKYSLQKNIFLLGFMDNEAKYKIIKESKVLLFPSSYESWGIVVAESFACGVPVVAFDIAATRKFKEGIVLVKDNKSFVDKIIVLLSDYTLYSRLSMSARESAQGYAWNKSAEAILYKED